MTTSPVPTITDEQIAEIEADIAAQANLEYGQCRGGVWVSDGKCRKCGATANDNCRNPLPERYAIPQNVAALISRLRAAERELRLWSPIIDEVHRRAGKECCLEDRCDFTLTVAYDDYAAIDTAMKGEQQ